MLISEYRGHEMYTDRGKYFGEIKGVVLDLDEGVISGFAFGKERDNWTAVPYDRVTAIGDIVILRTGEEEKSVETKEVEEREEIELGEELGEV